MYIKTNKRFLAGNFYAFLVLGMFVLMTGALLPYLIEDFGLNYREAGLLLSLQATTSLVAGLLGGIAWDIFGRKTVLISGTLCLVFGFGGIAFIKEATLLFVFISLSGVGWGILNMIVNTAVSESAQGKASIINLLHMCFSIGGFLAPVVIFTIIKLSIDWRYGVVIVGLMAMILVIIFGLSNFDSPKVKEQKYKTSFDFFRDKRFYIFVLILFFYVGTETSVNGWVVTYINDTNIMDETGAQNVLSVIWVSVILGRLLCSYISRFLSKETLIFISSISGSIFFILFLMFKAPFLIILCSFGIGISIAGIYPTTVANASYLISMSGVAGGFLFSLAGIGGLIIPYVVGDLAEKFGISVGMSMIIGSFVLLVLFSGVNLVLKQRKVKALIFDLDGTIGETVPLCLYAFKKAIEPLLGKDLSDEEIKATFGASEEGTVRALIPNHYEEGIKSYLNYYDELHGMCPQPFEGMTDILEYIKGKGIIIGMVTGKGKYSTRITLSKYNIDHYFDIVETGSIEGSKKTEGINTILKQFRLKPTEAIYIGDAPGDILAARKASVKILSVAWSDSSDAMRLKELSPDEIFYDLDDFKAYIENIV